MKVYVVSWCVPDDNDTTQVIGVCTSMTAATSCIENHIGQMKEICADGDPDCIEYLPDQYITEEHDLID